MSLASPLAPHNHAAVVISPGAETRASSRTYPLGYVPALDGLRGLMTLGVLAVHTWPFLPGTMIFMDIFFSMSGYLITSLLIADHMKYGRINFKRFYLRRFWRLYPALATMLFAMLAVSWFFSSEFWARVTEAAVSFFYLTNYWGFFGGTGVWFTAHTWSLAVEEQFYILWPLCFAWLLRYFGMSWTTVKVILVAVAGFALWRAWLTYSGAGIGYLYGAFDTRADALLLGCAAAVVFKIINLDDYPRLSALLAWSLVPLAALELAAAAFLDVSMRWYYYVPFLFGAIPGIITIASFLQSRRNFMHKFYESPPLVFCGRICYGLYLWHFPVFTLMRENLIRYEKIFVIGWPITFALALASYYLIERHAMRTRPI